MKTIVRRGRVWMEFPLTEGKERRVKKNGSRKKKRLREDKWSKKM